MRPVLHFFSLSHNFDIKFCIILMMATGGLETAESLWALIPVAEQANIKKMSDNRLREKLAGAGIGQAELGAMDRTSLLEAWIRHVVAESCKAEGATAAVAVQSLPVTPVSPLERGRLLARDRDREIEREKIQLERERMQAKERNRRADREWEERKLQTEREDRIRNQEREDRLEREKLQLERDKLAWTHEDGVDRRRRDNADETFRENSLRL